MDGTGQRVKPTLKELLLTETARAELVIPARGGWRRRAVSGHGLDDDDPPNKSE